MKTRFLLMTVFTAMIMIASVSEVSAAQRTNTWNGSSSTDWNTAANWSLGEIPKDNLAFQDNVVIPAGLTNYPVIGAADGVCRSIASMANGTSISGTGTLAIGNNAGIVAVTGTASISCPISMPASPDIGVTGTLTISGVISGAETGLTKSGTGTLILSGDNTYIGSTTINAGTLKLGAAGDATNTPLGRITAGTSVADGATLDLNGFTLGTAEDLELNGTGISGGGALTNSSATGATYSGLINLGSAGSIVSNSGNIILSNTGTISGIGNDLTLGGTATGSSLASIIGTVGGSVTKSVTGTWTLSGSSSYLGSTTISAGTLKLGAAGDATNTPLGRIFSGTSVADGAALDLNGFTLGTTEALTLNGTGVSGGGALTNSSGTTAGYSGLITLGSASSIVASSGTINVTNTGTITGATFALTLGGSGNGSISSIIGTTTGSLTKNGSGTWTLSGANTYTGATTVNGGTLKAGVATQAFGVTSAVTLANTAGVTLDITGYSNTIGSLTGGGGSGGNVTLGAATLTIGSNNASPAAYAGTISGTGAVIKSGTGTLILSGDNSYSGLTTVSAGTLKLGAAGGGTNTPLGTTGAGTSVTSGASLDLNGFTLGTSEALTLNGTGVSGGGALNNSSASPSTYSGLITLGSSTSIVSDPGNIILSNAGTITGTGYGLTLGGTATGSSLAGIIETFAGTVTKTGTGTWTLSGSSTYTGLTTISSGTLKLGAAGDATNTPLGRTTSGTSVTSGAVLDLNGFTLGTSEPLTLNGTGISSGGALINSSGTSASFTGIVTLESATSIGPNNIFLGYFFGTGITGGQDLTKVGSGELSLEGTVTLNSLTISTGTLTASPNGMWIAGDFTNNGTFSNGDGTVIFNGSGTQTIGGTGGIAFKNLTISSGTTVFGASRTISGRLEIGAGAKADLTNGSSSTSGTLVLNNVGQPSGTWGSMASSATHKTDSYFLSSSTGIVTVASTDCTDGTWIGTASTDWHDPLNWCGGAVPTSSTNVIIPPGVNQPVIGAAATCADLTINNLASLTISGSNTLTVSGNWVYSWSATFTPNTGTVIFNGAAQTITGTAFYNLTLAGSGIKEIDASINVAGVLSMEGTATISCINPVFYGSSATLQYNTTTSRTASSLEWRTPFTASGGVVIKNTGVITLNADKTFTGAPLTIDAGAELATGSFSVSNPNALNMQCGGSSGASISGTGTLTLGGNISVTDAGSGTAGATISCPVALGATRTFTVADDGTTATDLTMSGIVSGPTFGIIKSGAGTMELSGLNTYTGSTSVNAGILRATNNTVEASVNGSFGNNAGALYLAGGTIQSNVGTFSRPLSVTATNSGLDAYGSERTISSAINPSFIFTFNLYVGGTTAASAGGQPLTLSGTISNSVGTLGLTKVGTSTVTLSNTNTFTGGVGVNAGVLSVATINNGGTSGNLGQATAAASNLVLGGGTLRYTGSTSATDRAFTLTTATSSTIDVNTNELTISGAGANTTGSLTKIGSGTLTLSGANAFSGGMTLGEGQLNINHATAIGSGTFSINGGTIDNTSGGSLTLTNNNTQSWTGDFTFTGTRNLNLGTGAVILDASHQVTVNGGTLTVGGAIGGGAFGLTKSGSGILTLSGANTFSGGMTLGAGQLNINHATAIGSGTFIINGGTIDNTTGSAISLSNNNLQNWNGDFTFTGTQSLDLGTGSVTPNASRQVTVSGNVLTVGGAIGGGAIGLTKSGSGKLILSGANTYTGVTTINTGVLSVSTIGNGGTAGGIGQATNAASNLVLGGATLQYTGATASTDRGFTLTDATTSIIEVTANNLTVSGSSAATTGSLKKTGAGTLTLSGANAYTGVTTINEGILSVSTIGNGGIAGGIGQATSSAANLVFGGGTLQYSGTTASTDRAFTLPDDINIPSFIDITTSTLTISGASAVTSGGLAKIGSGTLVLSGENGYTGPTWIQNGTLRYGIDNALSSSYISIYGGTLDISTFNDEIGNLLMSSGSVTGSSGVFTVSAWSEVSDGTISAILAGGGYFGKPGSGTVTMSGASTFTGGLYIDSGIFQLATANERLNNNLLISLNGGTFSTGATAGFTETVGTLELYYIAGDIDNSTISLGTGSHTLTFAASSGVSWSSWGHLTITGWSGNWNGTAGTAGRIFVGSDATGLTSGQLAKILFKESDDIYHKAAILGTGELVPTNEVLVLSTTTFVAPSCVHSVTVECWGGGGGGGASTHDYGASGGGAGGSYAKKVVGVTPGNLYTVNVGTGGAGGTTSGSLDGATGNPSWFSTTGTVYAQGGAGGTGVSTMWYGAGGTGSSSSCIGDLVYRGGSGAGGDISYFTGGGGGGGAGSTGNGGDASGGNGGTGRSMYGGNGGSWGMVYSNEGAEGSKYGGGGSGVYGTGNNFAGGGYNGADGLVFLTCNYGLTLSVTGTLVICNSSSTDLSTQSYSSYLWSTGGTSQGITVSPSSNTTYTVTVTDADGCTGSASATVTVNVLPTPVVTATVNPVCNGGSTTLGTTISYSSYYWSTTGTTSTISVSPVTNTLYTVTVTDANGCTAAAGVTVTIYGSGISVWLGTTSTDWHDGTNWCGGTVPTASTDVIIPAGGNQPVIGAAAECAGMTIDPGATLAITGSNTLTVSGNWSNSGTFTANSGTVIFNLAGAQTVGTGPYNNLTLGGSGEKTTAGVTVNGILSVEGTATASATITYGSAATLKYNTATSRTVGSNEWISPFAASGGVVITNTGVITLNADKTFTGAPLTIDAGAELANGSFSISSPNALNMQCGGSSGATISGSGVLTLGGNVTVTDAGSGENGATISCPVSLGATRTFTVADDGTAATDLVIGGIVSGSAFGITKAGSGTLELQALNTYTGVTTINSGVLSVSTIGDGGVAGGIGQATNAAANLVIGNGTLQYTGATATTDRAFTLTSGKYSTIDITTNTLTISGASAASNGALSKIGSGTLVLAGQNKYTGQTGIMNGTLRFGVDNALISDWFYIRGATLDVSTFNCELYGGLLSSGTITGSTGVLTITNTFDFYEGIISAIMAGTGDFKKENDEGTVTMTRANTFSTVLLINDGILQLAEANERLDNNLPVVFAYGTLSTGSTTGFSETVGTLALDNKWWYTTNVNPGIALGTGSHTLTFAASSGVSWTTSTQAFLTITGWSGSWNGTAGTAGRIFVGSDATGLTSGQLAKILFKDADGIYHRATVLSTGEVVPTIDVMVLSTATFIAPPCVESVTVECWGGGGGSGAVTSFYGASGGGAGGSYAKKVVDVTPGNSYTVTVGTGGAGGTTTGSLNGETGNPSWFSTTGTVYAQGGAGGTGVSTNSNGAGGSGSSGSCIGDLVYRGGNGADGVKNMYSGGGGGGGAGSTGIGGDASGRNGGTGTSMYGGIGGSCVTGDGNEGLRHGGGGSGVYSFQSYSDGDGLSGADGLVVITCNLGLTPSVTGTLAICNGSSTDLSTQSYNSYIWSTGGTSQGITVSPSSNTTYTVTVTDASNCTGTASATVTVNANPTPIVTATVNPICSGGSTTLGTSISYSNYYWSTTGTTSTISVSPVTNSLYTVTVTDANGCTATTGATVTVNSSGVWLGVTSTSWVIASNWCGGVPTSTTDVKIPSTAPNQPVIPTPGGSCNNITIDAGASLTISGSNPLNIYGNLTNNGGFTANTSTVTFMGTSAQSIGGSTGTSFSGLTINNASATVSLTNSCSVSGTLTLTTGALSVGANTLTLNGAIAATSGSLTGDATSNITFGGSGASTTLPLVSGGLNNLTINRSLGIISGADLTINGTLTLTTGAFNINGRTLTFQNGDTPIARTSGTLTTNASSSLVFGTPGNTGGAAFIIPAGTYASTISSLTVNRDNALTLLSTDLNLTNLILTKGVINSSNWIRMASDGTIFRAGGSIATGVSYAGPYNVQYDPHTSAITVGPEITAGTVVSTTINNVKVSNTAANGGVVLTGSLYLNGTMTIDAGCSFTHTPSGFQDITFNTAGAKITNNGTFTANTSSTFRANANGTINGSNPVTLYNATVADTKTLTLSNAGNTINGTLTLNYTGVLASNAPVYSTGSGLSYYGDNMTRGLEWSADVSGTFGTTPGYPNNVTVNVISLNLGGGSVERPVKEILSLVNGYVTTGTNTVTVVSGGSVIRTSGRINGNLKMFVPSGTNPFVTFPVGDASNYTPVTVTLSGDVSAGTGSLTAKATAGDDPQVATSGINSAKSVNRYYTITNSTVIPGTWTSYGAEFTYVSGDNDGGTTPANYVVRRYSSGTWYTTTISGTPTTTSATATGMTGFSEFAIGETTGVPVVSTHPSNSAICTGNNTSFYSASNSVPAPTVKWQRDAAGGGFADIDGTTDGAIYTNYTTNTLNITGATTSQNNYQYRAVFTNINGSVNSNPALLTVYESPTVVIVSYNNVSCYGLANGSISVTGSGGTSPYQYEWNLVPVQSTASITDLSAGSYTVTVTDNHGCTATGSMQITIPIEMVQLSLTSVQPVCPGGTNGSVTITVGGGTSPYGYKWSTDPQQTTQQAAGLSAGTYTVTVSDAHGCTLTSGATLTQPGQFSISLDIIPVSCYGNNNGAVNATVTGGNSGYTYHFCDNANNCQDGSTAQWPNLAAGIYYLTVTDSQGCTATAQATITQPAANTPGVTGTLVICSGSSTNLSTQTYTSYVWSTGGTDQGITVSPTVSTAYTVTVTDAIGCKGIASVTVTVNANPVISSLGYNAPVSHSQTLILSASVSGGASPYSYNWSGSAYTGTAVPAVSLTGAIASMTGTEYITVTDAVGCLASSSMDIIVYGTPLYVNDNAWSPGDLTGATGNDNNPGTQALPLRTIQKAVSVAMPADVINVDAGTFTEQVLIRKDIELNGAGAGVTILKAPASGHSCVAGITGIGNNWNSDYILAAYPPDWNGPAATGTPISVRISGFTFDANATPYICDRYSGVFFGCVKNADITRAGLFNSAVTNFNPSDLYAVGVSVLGDSKLTVENNVIDFTLIGVSVYGDGVANPDPDMMIKQNTLYCLKSSFLGIEYGAGICYGATGAIENNTMTDASYVGILVFSSNAVTVINNTIANQEWSGIGLYNANNCQVGQAGNGNTIYSMLSNGIYLVNSGTNTVEGNTISAVNYPWFSGTIGGVNSGDAGWGIAFNYGSNNNTITGNDITTSDVAIENWNGSGNSVTGNKIYGNFYGVHNATATTMNATGNWWGSAKGPKTSQNSPSTNPCGDGQMASLYVNYEPWKKTSSLTTDVYKLIAYTVTGDATICAGSNTDITLSSSQTGTNYEYRLYKDLIEVPLSMKTGTGTSLIWNVTEPASGSYSYTVKATNTDDGCELPMTGYAAVAFNPQPEPPAITMNPNVPGVCSGTDVSATFGSGTGGVGCTDQYYYRYEGTGGWSAYGSGIPLTTTSHTQVEIKSAREGCIAGCTAATSTVSWSVYAIPAATVTGTLIICNGNSTTLSTQPYNAYIWSTGGTGQSIGVSPSANTTYTVTVTDANGCKGTASATVSVNTCPTVSGTLKYYNAFYTPMNNVTLNLMLGSGTVATSTTNGTGYFAFNNISNGSYTISVTNNNKTEGGINSTDALGVNIWSSSPSVIQYVKFLCGDVAGSGPGNPDYFLNSTDAQRVQLYWITFGNLSFDRPSWVYWKVADYVSSNFDPLVYPVPKTNIPVIVSGSNVAINIYSRCSGDWNGSFIPGTAKSESETIQLIYTGTKRTGAGAEIELPVIIMNKSRVTAISLVLGFPTELVEVEDVYMKRENGRLDWSVKGDELRIGWNYFLPEDFASLEELVVLKLKTSKTFTAGQSIRFTLAANPLNELAGEEAVVIPDAILGIDAVEANPISINEQFSPEDFTFANHPNPFNEFTILTYSLPVNGKVTIEIRNQLGENLRTLVNDWQQAGDHAIRFDTYSLLPGVYTATLRLESNDSKLIKSIKLVRYR